MFVRKAHSFKTSYTLRPLFTEGMHLLVFMSVLYAVGFVIGLVIYYSFPTSLQNGFIVRIHEAIVSLLTGSTVPHVVITESTVELLLLFFCGFLRKQVWVHHLLWAFFSCEQLVQDSLF